MEVNLRFMQRHPILKDILSLITFVSCVIIGTLLLNTFVFRSYNVVGVSMENTLHGNDRIIVNRLTVSASHFLGEEYIPERGQIIVFSNGPANGVTTCKADSHTQDQYIIKRTIAFPGERVVVQDGILTVYNDAHPDGFHPDDNTYKNDNDGPKKYTTGNVDIIVPEGELFVSGDNREGSHSKDSRNGLGTIPFCRIIGPAIFRIYPFDKIRLF